MCEARSPVGCLLRHGSLFLFSMTHTCKALVIHCIDFRFQTYITDWLNTHVGKHTYDRVALAGGVYDFYTIFKQVDISNLLHKIEKVILINHEDCGAYGAEGTKERHEHDLAEAERKIEAHFPHLDVETYYVRVNGTFEQCSKTNPRKQS